MYSMKGYLKSGDTYCILLAPKVTTIGREGCDFIIQNPGVDQQHAVIEFSDLEDCFVLQDLNTAQGTYVNEVRVQNAAVRLAPGDMIRFGYGGTPYQLEVENPPPVPVPGNVSWNGTAVNYPPVQYRPAWTQPLTMTSDHQPSYAQPPTSGTGLPYLPAPSMSCTVWAPVALQHQQQLPQNMPRPPIQSRPLSAGGATYRKSSFERVQIIPATVVTSCAQDNMNQQTTATTPQVVHARTVTGGWMGGASIRPPTIPSPNNMTNVRTQNNMDNYMTALQEKDQKIITLSEEISCLRSAEMETMRKDLMIQQLQQQVVDLQASMENVCAQSYVLGGDPDITQTLLQLEHEVAAKKSEVDVLKEQMSKMKSEVHEAPANIRQELGERVTELSSVRSELDRVKKDKNITSGLVTQMQRDMANKDMTISKLTREIENLKKETREKDIQLTAMSNRVTKVTDQKKIQEERDAREKELISLRHKFKSVENKSQQQEEVILALKQEMEKIRLSIFEETEKQKKLQKERDEVKAQFVDMERAERTVRVDLEQINKRMERFRSRVVQVTFSSPETSLPEEEISDDTLIEMLKRFLDERGDLRRRIQDLKEELKEADSSQDDAAEDTKKLREHVNNALVRMQEKGCLSSVLRQEVDLLESVLMEESVAWMKESFLESLRLHLVWQQNIETALESCGVNVKISNEAPDKHIKLLFAKWESSLTDKDRLEEQINSLGQQHEADVELRLRAVTSDIENRIRDAVEKATLEGEERLNRAIDEIRTVETEKRENAVQSERAKMEELENAMVKLRQSFTERREDEENKLAEASELVTQLEEYKKLEIQLREEIENLVKLKTEKIEKVQEATQSLEERFVSESLQYKEQIKQHSVTICAMEERLNKVTKRNKDYQEEIVELKKTVQNVKNKAAQRPPPAPKPKIIVQQKSPAEIAAVDQVVNTLRYENIELKKKLQDQQDVILGLRRDLNGASARLSDITGDLSESQKQEIEKNRDVMKQQKGEILELKQQMAKLSQIIDKQKEELKCLESDLSKEKSISHKFKLHIDEKAGRILSLEGQLEDEKGEQRKQLDMLENEGRITSEMTALGAQCRGERHEQVIMRQREALSELRTRIKVLEQARPPLPTHDQALQHVIILKKELAEMRANQALAEDSTLRSITSLDREVHRMRAGAPSGSPEVEMEKSAHRETMDALDSSEATFLDLLRSVATGLEMEDIPGLRAMAHIPKDERLRLRKEREEASQLLTNKIKTLNERLHRKDEMLQGYEQDLARLRQSQEIADRKSEQVDNLAHDVRSQSEECSYLRESLNRTRDRLDQEKRLNTAIKQKKTFHLENEHAHLNHMPSAHRCPPDDPAGKTAARRRQQREMTKRKDYEIKTLKNDLCQTEKQLSEREKRLHSLESSLGQQSAEIFE